MFVDGVREQTGFTGRCVISVVLREHISDATYFSDVARWSYRKIGIAQNARPILVRAPKVGSLCIKYMCPILTSVSAAPRLVKDSSRASNGYHKMSRSVSHKTSTHPIVALSIDIILSVIPSLVSHSIPFLSSPLLYAHNGHVRRLITHVTLTSIFFDIRVSYSPLPFISAAHTLRAIFSYSFGGHFT